MRRFLAFFGLTTEIPSFRDGLITGLATASFGSLGVMAGLGSGEGSLPTLLALGAVSCVSALALRVVLGNSSEDGR